MALHATSGALAVGAFGVLFLGASGSTIWLGVNHRQLAAANQRLAVQCEHLRTDLEQKDLALHELSDRRKSDEAEIVRLRQEASGHTTTISRLRDEVGTLEQRAKGLQEEITTARADGQVKEATLADLTQRLEETRARADAAANQLRAMGYTKDELTDQVSKLQTRLTESDRSLVELRKQAQEQQQAIARLNDDLFARTAALTALRGESETLRTANGQLQAELDSRPKPSPFKAVEIYVPSRDRKARQGG